MAKATIGEYRVTSAVAQGFVQEQVVDFSGGATQSTAFDDTTSRIRVCADAACQFLIGADPTAATTSQLLPANAPEYFSVAKGKSWKISFLASAL